MPKHLSIEEIQAQDAFHIDRANYYLEKKKNLPDHARRRKVICQKLYTYHREQHFKLIADVTGAPLQMSIL